MENYARGMAKRGPKGPMTAEHKAALATGRSEAKVVRDYLEALRANRPKRGRKRTPDSIKKRLVDIENELANADPVRRLRLAQDRLDLQRELAGAGATVDLTGLQEAFTKVASGYGARNGISYAAWREVGVEPSVLKSAGVSRAG